MATTRRKRGLLDVIVILGSIAGLVGFVSFLVDHFVNGTPSDLGLAGFCVVLILGRPVQNLAELVVKIAKENDQ